MWKVSQWSPSQWSFWPTPHSPFITVLRKTNCSPSLSPSPFPSVIPILINSVHWLHFPISTHSNHATPPKSTQFKSLHHFYPSFSLFSPIHAVMSTVVVLCRQPYCAEFMSTAPLSHSAVTLAASHHLHPFAPTLFCGSLSPRHRDKVVQSSIWDCTPWVICSVHHDQFWNLCKSFHLLL